jgi:hypothetical protein
LPLLATTTSCGDEIGPLLASKLLGNRADATSALVASGDDEWRLDLGIASSIALFGDVAYSVHSAVGITLVVVVVATLELGIFQAFFRVALSIGVSSLSLEDFVASESFPFLKPIWILTSPFWPTTYQQGAIERDIVS